MKNLQPKPLNSPRRSHGGGHGCLRWGGWLATIALFAATVPGWAAPDPAPPNIILVMADDLGFGDVGYNGNPVLKTPHLDAMAGDGVRFDRFYAAAPVCSPTRASCLTGRHPYRYGIEWAGETPLRRQEVTLAEALKTAGYATGHFGKWHVGGLSKTVKQSYFAGPVNPADYSPPWENGFDVSFSTESMMPTYNPYYHVGGAYGTPEYRFVQDVPVASGQRSEGFRWRDSYWTGPGQIVDEWLEGDDSRIIMDQALPFMQRHAAAGTPFLALVWFHTPHTPVVAGNSDRAPYADQPMDAQHWYGSISAMDRQVGRLREALRTLGIAENTLVWFCSDNGPSYIHDWNSSGGLRGKKATLWEGGIRVPAILEWPGRIPDPTVVSSPVGTSDFYPTLLALAGVTVENQPTLDGANVWPLIEGREPRRAEPIAFQAPVKRQGEYGAEPGSLSMALVGEQYKLTSFDSGSSWQLFDLIKDPTEADDIAASRPGIVKEMKTKLTAWQASCVKSAQGEDYASPPETFDVFVAGREDILGVANAAERYAQFREQNVVVTRSGRIVVVCQARNHSKWSDRSGQDLVCKWSDDHGSTWSQARMISTHGKHSICPNAAVYDRETDRIHVLYNLFTWDFDQPPPSNIRGEMGERTCPQYELLSSDGGVTWTRPRDITRMADTHGAVAVFGSGEGIQLAQGPQAGRLIVSGGDFHQGKKVLCYYSDDHGTTWQRGARVPTPQPMAMASETKVAELPGGRLILNSRSFHQDGSEQRLRTRAFSEDGGRTWTPLENDPSLKTVSCNGSLIAVDHPSGKNGAILLCSVPVGPKRTHGTVYVSVDEGKTWPHQKEVVAGEFAYSSLVELANGQVGLFYETRGHKDILLARFNLNWLLER